MYCCALCLSKFKLPKQSIFKLRALEYAISGAFRFPFCVYFDEAFAINFMKKLSFFNTNFQDSFFKV